MREIAVKIALRRSDLKGRLNVLREYIQHFLLKLLSRRGFFESSLFVGGTALRILYDVPRYSEDLDFSLRYGSELDFKGLLLSVKEELFFAGYEVSVTYKKRGNIVEGWIKVPGLLKEVGLSNLRQENLSIKIDLDLNPPMGYGEKVYLINAFFPITIRGFDLESLFAGKLHAIFTRKYIKGRDVFDVLWLMSRHKGLNPNLRFLSNALLQTGWRGSVDFDWREELYKFLKKVDWRKIDRDVLPFLQDEEEWRALTQIFRPSENFP